MASARCDVIDVIEEAIVLGRAVAVELVDGSRITARPIAIAARGGDDVVTFEPAREVPVTAIAQAQRAAR